MKIYYILIVLVLISCIKNKKNEVNLDLVPPIPRQANILSKDTLLNRKIYAEIKNSKDPEILLEALNFADFFNDSVFLWSKLTSSDKVRYMIFDLVNYTTLGDRSLYFIMKSYKYIKTEDEKIIFCISLLRDKNKYHLHEIAGYELNNIIKNKYSLNEFYIKWLSDIPSSESGYILVRTNQNCDDDLDEFRLDLKQENDIISLLANFRLPKDLKHYLMQYLYSVNYKETRGKELYFKITNLQLNSDLEEYNSELYREYKKNKPLFEKLDSIHTWMEMDKNVNLITELLQNKTPLMFIQVLDFNPSTLLDSIELCRMKADWINSVIENVDRESFYITYRYILRSELDLLNNYDTRFYENVYTSDQIISLRNRLIEN